jgi:hypothetical protein
MNTTTTALELTDAELSNVVGGWFGPCFRRTTITNIVNVGPLTPFPLLGTGAFWGGLGPWWF